MNLRFQFRIPGSWLEDVRRRMWLYKRCSSASDLDTLDRLRDEVRDRFGTLPPEVELLFQHVRLRLRAEALGYQGREPGGSLPALRGGRQGSLLPLPLATWRGAGRDPRISPPGALSSRGRCPEPRGRRFGRYESGRQLMRDFGAGLAASGFACLLAAAGGGCGAFLAEEEAVVASLGERELTQGDLDQFLRSRTAFGGTRDAPLLSALLEEFVREQLLLIAAEEENIEVSEIQLLAEIGALRRAPGTDALRAEDRAAPPENPEEESGEADDGDWLRSQVEARLLVDRLMETVVLGGIEATDEAARLEYEANRAFYARPETVTLSEQRFEDRESAEAGALRLREDGSSPDGEGAPDRFTGIGAFRPGELPDAVDRAVFGLEPGDTTDAVETPAGFRVFRVDQRLPAASLEFEEVEDVVRLTVLRREADARVRSLLAELQARHPVAVHADNLNFPYVGLLPRLE